MIDKPGLYFPITTSEFHLGRQDGSTFKVVTFGDPDSNQVAFVGDWTGDGTDKPGLHFQRGGRNTEFHLGLQDGSTFKIVAFQDPVDPADGPRSVPIAGDWDGSGKGKPGLYNRQLAQFHLADQEGGTLLVVTFGDPSFEFDRIPVIGDWNRSGKAQPGLYFPHLAEFHLGLQDGSTFKVVNFGDPSPPLRTPIAGDWDGSGFDKPGLYFHDTSDFHLGDQDGSTFKVVQFGDPNATERVPLAGNWDGRSGPLGSDRRNEYR